MNLRAESFAFGDPLGATVVFAYFALFSAVIGGIIFHLLRRLLRSLSTDPGRALHRGLISVTMSLGVGGAILGMLYVSSLSGFYEAEVQEKLVRLHYILPIRTKDVVLGQVAEVSRIPTFKGQWRCVISTSSGAVYYSVHAGPAAVQDAVLALRRRLAGSAGPQSRMKPSSQVAE